MYLTWTIMLRSGRGRGSLPLEGAEHDRLYLSSRCQCVRSDGKACGLCGLAGGWWSVSGSNRRPPACKAGALPAELTPRSRWGMVGRGGLEPPTSRLSGVRSNHLSYRPETRAVARSAGLKRYVDGLIRYARPVS